VTRITDKCPKCHLENIVKTPYGEWKCPGCGYSLDSVSSYRIVKSVPKQHQIKHGQLPVFVRINNGHRSDMDKNTLVSLLGHTDVNVRSQAISALIEFGDWQFIESLPDRYEKMQTPMEKKTVLKHFSKLSESNTIGSQLITKIISDLNHPNREIRVFSIARIKKMQLKESLDDLKSLENDPDPQIRQLAQNARMKIQGNVAQFSLDLVTD